jgi:hypothetical protein
MSDKYSTSPISQEILNPVSRIGVRDQKYFLHGFLFAVTILSTLFWGAYMMLAHEYTMQMIAHHASPKIIDEFSFFKQVWQNPALLYKGVAYSLAIMLVLFSHEMGHYLACCYYGINATLPFFLPAPIMTGTFGAFIKIRSPFPNRRSLFDVGLAGPIAGFVVMIPFLYFGLKWSIQVPPSMINADTIQFGDPLILQVFSHFLMKPNMETYIHPSLNWMADTYRTRYLENVLISSPGFSFSECLVWRSTVSLFRAQRESNGCFIPPCSSFSKKSQDSGTRPQWMKNCQSVSQGKFGA